MNLFLRYQKPLVITLLVAITILVYAPVRGHEFLLYDDTSYVTDDAHVQQGLNWENVIWALTAFEETLWKPVTLWSHMLDVSLFGLNPAGHLLMNLLIHVVNVILLFGVLNQMTGAVWRCALVAGLFALHPLNVESVAWVAERKNVLSTLFWLLTIWAYWGYTIRPNWKRYLGVMVLLVLGLMTKPMLVTLPCVLLLVDYWPLKRLGDNWQELRDRIAGLLLEKVPLLVPVALVSMLTLYGAAGGLRDLADFSLADRVGNALLGYGFYLKKMVWPVELAVMYPLASFRNTLSISSVMVATFVLVGVSLGVWWRRWSSRYLVVGWLWYLGTLVPVNGLLQSGNEAMADRYAYVPLIGVFVMVAWGMGEIAEKNRKLRKKWLVGVSVCVMIFLAIFTRVQLRHWQNTTTLFEHALEVTSNNYIAHHMLGIALQQEGKPEAADHFRKALEIKPTYVDSHTNLASLLIERGSLDEAEEHLNEALRLKPDSPVAHADLGIILYRRGRFQEATAQFLRSLEIAPHLARSHNYLGIIQLRQGQAEKAAEHFSKALESDPRMIDAQRNMGLALSQQGRIDEAVKWYSRLLQSTPDDAMMHNNLGVMLNRQGKVDEARHHFSEAVRIDPDYSEAHENLKRLQPR